jgi:SAM-dependent methyltransferase
MQTDDQRLRERLQRLRQMISHVRPGKIVEYGCGSGFVLEFLASEFPNSLLVGVDKSSERLAAVVARGLPNVIPFKADISHDIFPAWTFSTAVLVGVLHEVFSARGQAGVVDVLKHAGNATDGDGVVLIQDFLSPGVGSVEMSFKSEEARVRFFRFAAEFRPRGIEFETIGHGVRLDIADAVEFVSKYRSETEEDWEHEMGETHFFSTEGGFRNLAGASGFEVEVATRLPASENRLREFSRDIGLGLRDSYAWIQLVLKKTPSPLSA